MIRFIVRSRLMRRLLRAPVLGRALQRVRMWRRSYYFHKRMMCRKKKYRRYEIGYGTYGDPEVLFENSRARLHIGRFCAIGAGVTIFLGEGDHRTNWITTYDSCMFDPMDPPSTKGDVRIGNDVWIGTGATILSGVRIGNGAVIGARSVVAKDVPAYAIVVGNPGRVIKYRFEPEAIAMLERIAWWDWPLERIEVSWPFLRSDDLDGFIRRYDGQRDASILEMELALPWAGNHSPPN